MSLILTVQVKVGGVLTNADSTPVLSDPTNTYGVRRTDTLAVIVANNTAMTLASTGIYTYTIASPVAGITYQYYGEVVVNGNTYHIEKYATVAGSGMTLADARAIVRYSARNAADDTTTYSDTDVDWAVQRVCDDFLRATKCTLATSSLTLTISTAALPALPTGFSPDRLVKYWIAAEGLIEPVSYEEILELQVAHAESTGLPSAVAFTSRTVSSGAAVTTGVVYPTPDATYTSTLLWLPPLTSFTAGTATPGAVTLNIEDEHLRAILRTGGAGFLQENQVEHQAIAAHKVAQYETYRNRMKIAGSLGSRSFTRALED